jgi:hypothetical protein
VWVVTGIPVARIAKTMIIFLIVTLFDSKLGMREPRRYMQKAPAAKVSCGRAFIKSGRNGEDGRFGKEGAVPVKPGP